MITRLLCMKVSCLREQGGQEGASSCKEKGLNLQIIFQKLEGNIFQKLEAFKKTNFRNLKKKTKHLYPLPLVGQQGAEGGFF